MVAVAFPYKKLEKIIQEKCLYIMLINNYFDKDILGIVGNGFWLAQQVFQIEIYVNKEMSAEL